MRATLSTAIARYIFELAKNEKKCTEKEGVKIRRGKRKRNRSRCLKNSVASIPIEKRNDPCC